MNVAALSQMTMNDSPPRAASIKSNGCKVLVVDDDLSSRDLLAMALENEGYEVASAEHGARAVAMLEAGLDPDLILTDLQMPVMSGWELCAQLKGSPAWRSIPLVVLCGMTPQQRGELQVEDAFEKLTDLDTLLHRIAELCGV